MSKIKLTNSSGGSSLEISAPNTNSDRTITLPDATGTLIMSDGDGSSLSNVGPSALSDLSTYVTVSSSDPAISTNPSAAGHLWMNKANGKQYICTDSSSGANVWKAVGGLSGNIS